MAAEQHPRKSEMPQDAADALRRAAEERLDALVDDYADADITTPSREGLAAALYGLRVHQIELEMQNEELRSAQLELGEQREKYYELFDLAPVGYLTLSDKGIVGSANLTAAHLLGVERQLLVGQPFSAFVNTEDRDAFYLHQRTLEKTGEPQTCEFRLVRVEPGGGDEADGEASSHFWAHLEGEQHESDDGEMLCWMTFTDIDELRREEQALRESEERFSALFEQAPMGYQSLDEDGRVI